MENQEAKETVVLYCPLCGAELMYMMPDGQTLFCPVCNKYFKNDNGVVGEETTYPYTEENANY